MIFESKIMAERHGYANLNTGSIWWEKRYDVPRKLRPFKDPVVTHQMEEEYHRYLGLDWSYGGWMEDRSNIRRGTYLEKDKLWIHTGIDVNHNPGIRVLSLADGPIVYQGTDAPLVGGWGYHVIQIINFRGRPHALVYAHLAKHLPHATGVRVTKGVWIGTIGNSTVNGVWRPHLHLNLFADIDDVTDWENFSNTMDGYVKESEIMFWARKCPDPTPLIFA
jgi:hypothetical protein